MLKTSPSLSEILNRGVEEVISRPVLEKKLKSGKKLRIKHGVDPTTSDLHLGYAVIYNKLRALQELGHTILFLVGDFTARFGDPTDRAKSRSLRDKKEIEDKAQSYIKQIGIILDLKKTEIRRNSEWYDKMSAENLLKLQSKFTVSRLLERDMFAKRQRAGKEIGYHEPVYPILQAYDSVMLKSDLTVIGTDQKFNELQARILQKEYGQPPQEIITMKLLIGTDGRKKMSQSLGNYIGLTESPSNMYGKVMSIPDNLIMHYYELATKVPAKEFSGIKAELAKGKNPRDIKAKLAGEIVGLYYSRSAADQAGREFNRVFKEKKLPSQIPSLSLKNKKMTLIEILILSKLATSKSDARRLIEQNAVKIDNKTTTDWQKILELKTGSVIQVGKRKFIKIK